MEMLPQEAHFYGVIGKAKRKQKDEEGALVALNKAISLNDQYFEFYLERGLVRQTLGYTQRAKRDFQRSQRLLPTQTATHFLQAK